MGLYLTLTVFFVFLLGFLAFVFVVVDTDAQSGAAQWLHAEGNLIKNESGEIVVLRGANLIRYNWKWPGTASAIPLDHGIADVFTTPVNEGGWGANSFTLWVESIPVNDNDSLYMEWLDGMVDIAIANSAYAILSWHADHPQNSHPSQITDEGIEAMRKLAARYRNVPNVLYAAQAEPGFWTNSVSAWLELRDRQEETIDAIRQEHPQALVGVSGTAWSQRVDWMLDNPVRRDNIFVKPHLYEGRNSGTTMEQTLQSSGTWAVAQQYPIVIGEFGWGGRSNDEDMHVLIDAAEEQQWGWQAWNLSDEGCPCLLVSQSSGNPTEYGQLVKGKLADIAAAGPVPSPTPTPTPTPTLTPTPTPAPTPSPNREFGDFTGDGRVGVEDLSMFLSRWYSMDSADLAIFDINGPNGAPDGKIDIWDANVLMRNWNP